MTSTPAKPTATAPSRKGPTRSPSKGTDSSVIISGATKNSAVASPSGITASAVKKLILATTRARPRMRWKPQWRVRRIENPPSNQTSTSENQMPIAERANTIWCKG